ncbi:hypothetical protein SND87_17830, partial [Escherichia coli]|nr:hypothetical protein [Escherichia coli]
MQIDIKTSSVKPLRNTYAYIEKRFGDKPASRYQEATYDIQEEINFHLQIINTLKCIFSMGLRNDCLIKF